MKCQVVFSFDSFKYCPLSSLYSKLKGQVQLRDSLICFRSQAPPLLNERFNKKKKFINYFYELVQYQKKKYFSYSEFIYLL